VNEMDLLTRLRAEVPATVSPRAAHRFHAGLAAERSTGPQRATPWWRVPPSRRSLPRLSLSRLALATGLAAAVAAGIVVAVPRSAANRPAPANHRATQAAPLTVRELAYRAAAAALAAPSVAPGQWMYAKEVIYNNCTKKEGAKAGKTAGGVSSICATISGPDTWQTADDTRWAYYDDHGHLVVKDNPRVAADITYAAAVKLPANPQALVKYLYGYVSRTETVTPPGNPSELWLGTFYALAQLLQEYVLPPRLAAEFFGALPYVHGVMVAQAPGYVAFTWEKPMPIGTMYSTTLILDPSTYTVIGQVPGPVSDPSDIVPVPVRVPVSGPGVRP
jgi:hypothetical protein